MAISQRESTRSDDGCRWRVKEWEELRKTSVFSLRYWMDDGEDL